MASGKRASMREGPLADLFRRTEKAADDASAAPAESGEVPAPSTPAAQERRAPEPPPHPRDTGYPHPALSTPEDEPPAAPEPRVPTPQERLRHAFSTDIPDDILDRAPARRREQHDPYARMAEDPKIGRAHV